MAIRVLERALAIGEKRGLEPIDIADARFALSRALWEHGDHIRALALASQAREAYASHPEWHADELAEVTAWLARSSGSKP